MDEEISTSSKVWGLSYWAWAAVFLAAMAMAATANILGLVPGWARVWVMFAPLVLVPPMARAQLALLSDKGISSPALSRYSRNMLLAGGIYMVVFISAAHVYDRFDVGRAATIALALASIAPVMGMIWTMARYLREEQDEYLRNRAINAALFGLLLVLVLGSLWGFLETFGLLPHVWAWWVFPVWAIGLGIGNCWEWMRGR